MSMTRIVGDVSKVIDLGHSKIGLSAENHVVKSKSSNTAFAAALKKPLQSTQLQPLSKAQSDFVFYSMASGASDAPLSLVQQSGRAEERGVAGFALVTATASTAMTAQGRGLRSLMSVAIAHPLVPPQVKAAAALGVGAFAVADLIQRYLPETLSSGNVSSLLGRPPGVTGGALVRPEHRDESSGIPARPEMDPTPLNWTPEGKSRIPEDASLHISPGGSRISAELGQVGGREAMKPPAKIENILLSESSKMPLERMADGTEFYLHQDDAHRLVEIFHNRPQGAGAQAAHLDSGVSGVYEKKKTSVELNTPADTLYLDVAPNPRYRGQEAMRVKDALENIKARHGNYPEAIHLTLPQWQSAERDQAFNKAYRFQNFTTESSWVNDASTRAEFESFMNDIHSDPVVGRAGLLADLGYEYSYFLPVDELGNGNSVVLTHSHLIKARERQKDGHD